MDAQSLPASQRQLFDTVESKLLLEVLVCFPRGSMGGHLTPASPHPLTGDARRFLLERYRGQVVTLLAEEDPSLHYGLTVELVSIMNILVYVLECVCLVCVYVSKCLCSRDRRVVYT